MKPFKIKLLLGLLLITVHSCTQPEKASQNFRQFTLLEPSDTGISFSNDISDSPEHSILKYANFYGGAGVGIGDFNNDGLQDIFFAGNLVPDKLYLNQGNLKFKDITEEAGIVNDGGWSTGVTLADVNNDGYLDIYVSRELYDDRPEWRRNLLYLNRGDGTFEEKAEAFNIANDQRTRHSTFLDFDKDGLLDLFLLTQPPNPGSLSPLTGSELIKPEFSLKLYKNKGGVFEDVTESAGVNKTGFPNAVSASDLNNDGFTDLYVANDFYIPDFLFLNNQDGTFTDVAEEALNHVSYYSMGVDVADIDNDENLDVFVLDMVAEDNFRLKSNMSGMDRQSFWDVHEKWGNYQYMYNTLHLNNGNVTFSDVAQFADMAATDWSWANLIADIDNDGLKDMYVTNGLFRDIRNTDGDKAVAEYVNEKRFKWLQKHPDGGNIKSAFDLIDLDTVLNMIPSQPLKNYAFRNEGNLEFKKNAKDWGLDDESFSNGAAYGDLDNDGDLDLVVNNINAPAYVYRNNAEQKSDANFIRIKLEDNKGNTTFGTRVTLYAEHELQSFETTNVRGIYSTSENIVHFGLGNTKQIDSMAILWPDGRKSLLKDLVSNQLIIVNHDEAKEVSSNGFAVTGKEAQLFSELTGVQYESFFHEENEFDDFDIQVLLPHKLSQFGPAMASADVNGDGLDDIFIGGASGLSAKLMMQKPDGSFSTLNTAFWKKEAPYEDVDALFLDINGDSHQDLFVVSGGNEFPANDFHYTDRLYLNDGQGNFTKAALLNANRESGSKVVAADYDKDGDLDLFVGARHKPHNYPAPPSSAVYENVDGQLINKTNELAPELNELGMVTDAVWTDYDLDEDLDLVLTGEWMPITVFSNQNGQFIKQNLPEFEKTRGWWFSLTQGDFDNDGDSDFIVGNLGLNYKYKTSPDAPFDIYYSDFDANGQTDIVLGYYNEGEHYPLRGFSCSSEQVPGLKKEFKKYDVFASLNMEQAYGKSNLENALHYQADTFASVYVENLGGGSFKLNELPNRAQLSNINDFLVDDFDTDGNLDVLAVGNLFVSEIETPRNDAGVGLFLKGDGKGRFTSIHHSESGFFTPGDAKKLAVIKQDGHQLIGVANNNAKVQFFRLNNGGH